jgi:hypothetical protein
MDTRTAPGRWPKRHALEFATGQARFVDDIRPQGLLHMAVVRSTRAHARIVSVDVSAAAARPGVVPTRRPGTSKHCRTSSAHPNCSAPAMSHCRPSRSTRSATSENPSQSSRRRTPAPHGPPRRPWRSNTTTSPRHRGRMNTSAPVCFRQNSANMSSPRTISPAATPTVRWRAPSMSSTPSSPSAAAPPHRWRRGDTWRHGITPAAVPVARRTRRGAAP